MTYQVGHKIGVYVIKGKLGQGSNSDVYLAFDTANNRDVALKVLRLEHNADRSKVTRFWNGGQAARALQHDHIVPVYDAGLADSHYYIAMKYLAGKSIEDLLLETGKPVPLQNTLHYLDQITPAIDFAHAAGIVHRDIKPSNILLSADRQQAYLTDFGVASLTGRTTKTEFGMLIGTPEYMSPEQIQGQKVDARSDIYSLGVTAYHMLTGQLPFDGLPATVLYNHINRRPPHIRSHNAGLPPAVNRPIAGALSKRPNRRQASATEFAQKLRRAAGLPVRAGPTPRPRAVRPGKGGRWARGGLGLALLAAAAVLAFLALRTVSETGIIEVTRLVTVTPPAAAAVEPTSTVGPTARPSSTTRPQPATEPATAATPEPAVTTAAATEAPPPAAAELNLISPPAGAIISGGAGTGQTFSWQLDRPLAANESFELRFFPKDGGEPFLLGGWRKESRVTDLDLNILPAGEYEWVVAVVRGRDGNWEADVIVSDAFSLIWGR